MNAKLYPYDESNDERLLKRIMNGDPEAEQIIFSGYYNSALLYCLHLCKDDRVKSQEIVQITFMKVLIKIREKNVLNLRQYLFASLRTNFIEQLRKDNTRNKKNINIIPELLIDRIKNNENEFAQFEKNDMVNFYLKQLTKNEQEIILLWSEGYSSKEIGRIVDKSESSISTRVGRIKEKMKLFSALKR